MTAAVLPLTHPIHTVVDSLNHDLDELTAYNPVFLSPEDKATLLVELTHLESRLAAAKLQVLAVATDLSDQSGAKDPGAWLSAHALIDRTKAHAQWKLARETTRSEPLVEAMTAGTVSPDHAHVITQVIDQLPHDLPTTLAAAEQRLIHDASEFRPAELRRIGHHILDVIAPDIADQAEARRLAKLEEEAAKKTRLTIKPVGDGTTKIYGTVPDHIGVRLRTILEAYTQPRVAALDADGRSLPRSRVMGEAFGQMLETLDPDRVPLHGGDATTLIVTIPLDQLHTDLGRASIEGSESTDLSAGQARRLACGAGIIPAVLGGASQPLDLGRTRRLFTPAQRKALKLRDHSCRAEDCTIPATWCDAHHTNPWTHGGGTNLDNALLLCHHHHRRAHDPQFDKTVLPTGRIRFHRRT